LFSVKYNYSELVHFLYLAKDIYLTMISAAEDVIRIEDKEFELLIDANRIQKVVLNLSQKLNDDYKVKNPVIIGVLNGAFIFLADLLKNVEFECEISFVKLSSYEGVKNSGEMKELIGLNHNINNRHILLVEDIVDTGSTVLHLKRILKTHDPASVKLISAIYKKEVASTEVKPEYFGFETGSEFLVGYGMDYNGHGRHLNNIYKLKEKGEINA